MHTKSRRMIIICRSIVQVVKQLLIRYILKQLYSCTLITTANWCQTNNVIIELLNDTNVAGYICATVSTFTAYRFTISCNGQIGRVIRVRRQDTSTLTVCELQAFGTL